MKASELRPLEYGMTLEGVLVIKTAQGYTVAYNHEVKRCSELPFDVTIKDVKTLGNEEYIIQFDDTIKIATDLQVTNFIRIALLNNKDTNHVTITRI